MTESGQALTFSAALQYWDKKQQLGVYSKDRPLDQALHYLRVINESGREDGEEERAELSTPEHRTKPSGPGLSSG